MNAGLLIGIFIYLSPPFDFSPFASSLRSIYQDNYSLNKNNYYEKSFGLCFYRFSCSL